LETQKLDGAISGGLGRHSVDCRWRTSLNSTKIRLRGVEFLSPPERQPSNGTLAHLRDPDGNILTLLGR
jgi:hypothetical protein